MTICMKKKGLTACSNTYTTCAECKLLDKTIQQAQKDGVPYAKRAAWIHRKNKGTITITRSRADGTLGCLVPCPKCRRELMRYHIRVRCVTNDGEWYDGYLDEPDAPVSKKTSGQRRSNLNWKKINMKNANNKI